MTMRKDLLTTCLVAMGTAATVLAILLPADLTAREEDAKAKAEIKLPKLATAGVELSLKPDKAQYNAGDQPALQLIARNTSDKPVTCQATVTMYSQDPAAMFSRMMPVQKSLYREPWSLKLKPGETRVVRIDTGKTLAVGHTVSFGLSVDKKSIRLPGAMVLTADGKKPDMKVVLAAIAAEAKKARQAKAAANTINNAVPEQQIVVQK